MQKILVELDPDFIFLTGDYISWQADPEDALVFLSNLKAKSGIWAVMGDYDYSRSRKSCLFCHEGESGKPTPRHSVRFLRNAWEQLELPTGSFWIGGLDPGGERPVAPVEPSRPTVRGMGPGILLSHSPMEFDTVTDDEDVLMLAGDTHGGQIPLPAALWRFLGYDKNACYEQGLFEKDRKKMIVSRGIGTSHIPVRFLRPPEIIVLHF